MPVWSDLLRDLRTKRELRQHELAARAEVSLRTVTAYERGSAKPRRDTLLKLTAALNADRQTTNTLLAEAGFDPLPTGRLARFV
jgi:transcriptional regulator with XRE-family HTH domain